MSYTAAYTSGALEYLAMGATNIMAVMVVLIVFAIGFTFVYSLFVSIKTEEEAEEEDFVEELPERNEYKATVECQNCKHEQKIPIVKGYDIEEAIKIGEYFCKICGSKKLQIKKAYWA